jgi:hypothetical protein
MNLDAGLPNDLTKDTPGSSALAGLEMDRAGLGFGRSTHSAGQHLPLQPTFSVADVEAALRASQGTQAYEESAYFAIFVQPNPAQLATYSYFGTPSAPNPTDVNEWDTSVISDPSSPSLGYSSATPCTADCSWAGFYKDPSTDNVTVISGANVTGFNFFLGGDWSDFVSPPYGWGYNDQYITAVMPATDRFTFQITTPAPITSNTLQLNGYAAALISGRNDQFTGDTKDLSGLGFTLTVTTTPEPAPWTSMIAGGLLLTGFVLKRSRERRSSRR